MSTATHWLIAIAVALAIGALAATDAPEPETADDIAAQQRYAQHVEHAAKLVEHSAMWSPMR